MLLKDLSIIRISNAVAAGQTAAYGTAVNVANFDGVLFLIHMGTITTGAVTAAKAQQGNASDGGDAQDLAGTGVTIADDQDNKIVAIDIYRPLQANGVYVRPGVTRATQNSVIDGMTAILYNGRIKPTALDATIVALSKEVGSPAFGTP